MTFELPGLSIIGDTLYRPTEEDLDEAGRQLGISLPPSYRAFALRYGYGLTAGLYMIKVPVVVDGAEWKTDLVGTSQELKEEIDDALATLGIRMAPDGTKDLVDRVIPFGASENGDILAWDPAQASMEGEMPIYMIGARKSSVRRMAADLGEFLRNDGDLSFAPRKPWG